MDGRQNCVWTSVSLLLYQVLPTARPLTKANSGTLSASTLRILKPRPPWALLNTPAAVLTWLFQSTHWDVYPIIAAGVRNFSCQFRVDSLEVHAQRRGVKTALLMIRLRRRIVSEMCSTLSTQLSTNSNPAPPRAEACEQKKNLDLLSSSLKTQTWLDVS